MTNEVFDRIPNATLSSADRTLKDASQNTIKLLGKTTLPVSTYQHPGVVIVCYWGEILFIYVAEDKCVVW